LTGIAAAAALGAVLMVGTTRPASAQAPAAQQAAQPGQPAAQPAEKKPKDTAEYDIANAVFVDINPASPNWQKAITDLNTWVQKYPESDWKNERLLYYLQAYASMTPPQTDKAMDYSAQLLALDLNTAIKDQSDVFKVLYLTALTTVRMQTATPQELATGEKGAKQLLAFLPAYFTTANKPATASDAQWAGLRKQVEDVGHAAIHTVAVYPGNDDVKNKDFAKAEQDFTKAVQQYPDDGGISYSLGTAIMSEKDPTKYSLALFEVARGAAMDPAKGGIADTAIRTQVEAYLKRIYTTVHGSDEGLDQLKQVALASPFPPAGFAVKTAAEIAMEKQKAFAEKYPETALWMGIKGMLAGPEGDANFASMKDTLVKGLKGKIMSGVPECRSKSVLIAVPDPEQPSTLTAEITLKLDKPLTGKPVAGTEIKWDGQPTAFTKEPLMLTMDVDQADIQGMAVDPCTVPAPKKAAPKPAPKKQQ
jgi:tetratricopeptide (TPR) repeat protein